MQKLPFQKESDMKPNYTAKKTAWLLVSLKNFILFLVSVAGVVAFFLFDFLAFPISLVFFAPLLVSIIWILCDLLVIKCEKYDFYDNKVVYSKGVFNRKVQITTFLGVLSVVIDQSFIGRVCNYGDITVDTVGRWDMDMVSISKPHKLKAYLESKGASKLTATFAAGPENFDYFDTSQLI